MSAGIDDIAVYIPRLYLEIASEAYPEQSTEFSRSRKTDPKKYLDGIGIAKMSIPDSYQDSTVLAANAILELMERNDLRPQELGRIDVATETGVDESKPVAAYVHGMLEQRYGKGSLKRTSGVEYKFACVSLADALETSLDWIWSGRSNGKSSIVCATDIAKYPLHSPGEPTQGAGAVALLVKETPRLLAYDRTIGTYMEDVDDFFRPVLSATAVVHGKYSEKCYLRAMEGAVDHWTEQAVASGTMKFNESFLDKFGLFSFHVPFPKMAEKAFAYLLRHFWRGGSKWKKLEAEIGVEPRPTRLTKSPDFEKAESDYMKRFMETAEFRSEYREKVADGMVHARETGNSYSASEKSSLSMLFETKEHQGADLTSIMGGSGNYGSGCKAKAFSWTVQEEWRSVARKFQHTDKLSKRRPVTLHEYETLHEGAKFEDGRHYVVEPKNEFVLSDTTPEGYRHYRFADASDSGILEHLKPWPTSRRVV